MSRAPFTAAATNGTLTLARMGTQTAESTDPTLNHLNLYDLLLLCLQSRDELSWTAFIRRSQPVIAGVVVKAVRRWTRPSVSLVDDLVQDTYLKLCANDFRALRQFVCRHDSAIFGFLKVVALNVVQDHFRLSYSQKRGCGKDGEQLEDAAILRVANSSTKDIERTVLLKEIEDSLAIYAAGPHSARDQKIFSLYYRHGLTLKEIAQLPDIELTVKGVESTVLRMCRSIKAKLSYNL